MAQEMYKHDALLHLVWCVATGDGLPGNDKMVTPEENSFINTINRTEGIEMNWDDFTAKRVSLQYDRERIIDEACKALRGCGKEWRIKAIGYMQRMAWVSQEDDLNNNMSDKEWKLVLRAQRELGLTDEERKNSYQSLPKK